MILVNFTDETTYFCLTFETTDTHGKPAFYVCVDHMLGDCDPVEYFGLNDEEAIYRDRAGVTHYGKVIDLKFFGTNYNAAYRFRDKLIENYHNNHNYYLTRECVYR